MADDIDIEEHDVLDNPRIKMEVIDYKDENINDFDEESYEAYQREFTPEYLEDVPSLYQNKIIVSSKPCDSTSEEEEPEILECSVVLEDWGHSLKNNPCFCSDCKILFPTENALDSHKVTVHSFLVAVSRNEAIKSTTKSSIARLTFETDSNMKISKLSNNCNQVFLDKTSVLKQSDERLTKKFSCDVCDLTFDSKISLEQHLRSLFSCLMYCCPVCFCYFKFTNKILSHMVYQHKIDVKSVPQPEKATYKCRFCAKSFRNTQSYNAHVNNVHTEQCKKIVDDKTQTKKFNCQPCNLKFPSAYSEEIHRVPQHAIEFETNSKSVDLDKQIKIEPLSPKLSHRKSQHGIESETNSKSVDLDKQIKIEPLSPKLSHRESQHGIESETNSKSVDLDKQIKMKPLSPKITPTVPKQELIGRPVPKSTLFKCSKCRIHFVSSLVALEHTKRCALKKGYWKCKICRIPFRLVDRHIHTIQHDWTDRFKILTVYENMLNRILCRCVSCKVCSDERTLMRNHERGCPKSLSFLCNMCNLNIHEKALTKHMKIHNKLGSESFTVVDFVKFDQLTFDKPTIKNLESKNPVNDISFLLMFNDKFKFYYYCPTCHCYMKVNKLSDKHNIGKCKRHILKRHCKLCGLTFSIKCLATHMKAHKKFPRLKLKDLAFKSTQSGKKVIPPPPDFTKCFSCEVKFLSTVALNNHVCNDDEAKICGYCGDMFSDLAYKLHVPFHEYAGERKTVIKNERTSDNPDKERAPKTSHRVSQHAIESKTNSISGNLDKQIKIEPLSPNLTHRVSQHAIESKTNSISGNLDKQIKIEPLSPKISERVSQHAIESKTNSISGNLDKQIKIEPLSPKISERVSQHAIESETNSIPGNLDKQIKIEPLSPKISERVSQHAIESETNSIPGNFEKQIKIEPLSPKITQQVSQHGIKTYSKSVNLDKQIKKEPLWPKLTHRVPQHAIKTYSKSVNLDKQIKIEPLSPKITQTDLQQEL